MLLTNFILILFNFAILTLQTSQTLKESKNDSVHLHDDSDIIIRTSLNDYTNNETQSWHWKFDGNPEYGFKVVLQIFDNSSIDEFYIKNSTDIIANKRSAKEFRPYYNDDNYISIYLSQGDKAYGIFFYAYVTLVAKKSFLFDRCRVKGNGTITDWYINTWASFVIINVHCYYNLAIPYNKEVDVEIGPLVIEKDVDFLQYTFDNNTVKIEDTSMAVSKLNRFTLGSYLDGRDKHYLWEYICDGSFVSLGTYVRFTEITCQCPKPYIQCTHAQMTGITDFTGRYCGNLHCKSTIGLCNSSTTLMFLKIQDCYFWQDGNIPERENYDVFTLYSNEEKVLEINYFNRLEQDFQLYLNPSNLYTLELTTYQSLIVKCLFISTQAQTVSPVNSEVTLTSANPYHFLDSGFSNSIIVKSDLQNDTFTLYSSRRYGIPVYYNESFSRRYVDKYCFSDFFPYSCQLTTDKFVIHKSSSLYPILSIHSRNYRSNGCLFNRNTFTTELNFDVPVTVVASSTYYCIATILIDSQTYSNDLVIEHYMNRINGYFYYHISSIWTNAKSETVKVFAGTDSYLFEFNSQTAKKWTSIDLFSNAYTIKVPKQTTIYLRLKRRIVDFLPNAVIAEPYENAFITHIYDPNFYGLISTPFYGTSKRSPMDTVNKISYYFKHFSMKITTLYYKMSAGESVSFIYRNQPDIRVNKTGDTFIFDNNNITLRYSKQENSSQSNGAIFLLQIIPETKENSKFKIF